MNSLIRAPLDNYEALMPLRIVMTIVGLTPISYTELDVSLSTIRASHVFETIYKVTVLCAYYLSVYYFLWNHEREFDDKNFIAQVASWTQLYLVAVVSFALIAFNMVHRKRVILMIGQLDAIDAVFRDLGVDVAYARLRSEVVLTIVCMTALIATIFACDYYGKPDGNVGLWISIFFPLFCYSTSILQFVNFLTFGRYRFKLLNRFFSKLFLTRREQRINNFFVISKSKVHVDNAIEAVKIPGAADATTYLDKIFELHDRLYEIGKSINFSFGFQILLCLTISFITILSCVYNLVKVHDKADTTFEMLGYVAWTALHVVVVFLIVWSTDATAVEANDTRKLLHRARNQCNDLKEPTEMYTLQLLHQKVTFSACGFFPLDYTLLYSIIGALTTYLVILIQFDMTITVNPSSVANKTNETTKT